MLNLFVVKEKYTMPNLVTIDTETFLPLAGSKANKAAVARVAD